MLDFYQYLQGCWKRNLQWREFGGGYRHLRSSNTLVCVEAGNADDVSMRALRWSFGQTLLEEDRVTAYVMSCAKGAGGDMNMEWSIGTHRCTGRFLALPQLAVFEFILGGCAIVVTYHIRGAHMMAVSIVEIDEGKTPTVQFGNMLRIDPSKYLSQQEAIEREEVEAAAR